MVYRKSKAYPLLKPSRQVAWTLRGAGTIELIRALTEKWLQEDEYTSYKYFVETCSDGRRIYLVRPAQLNKGFDFQVKVEGFQSKTAKRRSERPSHDDIVFDLQIKLTDAPQLRDDIFKAVAAVYDCMEPDEVMARFPKIGAVKSGMPIDKTLKILKWMFIEQDMTYWLGTRRNMLMNAIEQGAFGSKANLYHD